MGRMRQGWELTKKSWALLRSNPQLFRYPIVGAAVVVLLLLVFGVPALLLIDNDNTVPGAILAAIGIYAATFVAIFFSVALAAAAGRVFDGQAVMFSEGMAAARSRSGAIAGWAALSVLVGVLISALQRLGGVGATIAAAIVGTAWSLVSFMAVPVLAFEGHGPWETLKRSATLFKERWVGQVTGNIAVGAIVGFLVILPSILMVALGVYLWAGDEGEAGLAGGAILVAVGAILFGVGALISQAMRSVFGVALYRYASTGTASATFSEDELRSAVRTK
jgi:Family of unknown function (DUF6159)